MLRIKSMRNIEKRLFDYARAFFALSQSAVNALGSLIAISLKTFLLRSIPATLRPCIRVE